MTPRLPGQMHAVLSATSCVSRNKSPVSGPHTMMARAAIWHFSNVRVPP